ncbi:energy transducer TonB [Sphingopyxis sp. RIFCSPHIGHO2_12_FULL_65_19]|uniref:energy transducer TonB n=1 Tax=Sphingopyxis sp. RIFCSPHIGHO2_12_FULL_65_19 TaxID=1802172 RepID=UPI0008D37E62|nr:energy transducer TonB [Sphingopyxis sp. RIFCSPHIGHO2_12_FULL_65_19]OHD06456.1 MAG: energy transducer TonB [Sphingopyxis sp. RIFCSPHIGHO2_12_FULL_65_19]
MAYTGQISGRQRALSGGGALLTVVALGLGLARGLDLDFVRTASEAINAIAIPAPPPPRTTAPARIPSEKASGRAAAANRHAKAAAVAAPPPKLPPIMPPVTAAPRPGSGNDASAGATPDPGSGSGAGGRGDGTGAGGTGTGTGGGSKAVWRSGTIRDRDYPREARRAKAGGDVEVRFTIEPSGRVTGCRISRSSGDASLDRTTCALIEERFRFKPATNAAGDPVASPYGWRQSWWLEPRR